MSGPQSSGPDGRPVSAEVERGVRLLRLGFFGTLGLYGLFFLGLQSIFWLWGGALGLPGVYLPEGRWPWLTAPAWFIALILPAAASFYYHRRQDRRNFELLTRDWDSWRWFDHGVEMIGTEKEFSTGQEQSFARASILDPDDPFARNNLGSVLMQQGRLDEAIG
ncbi:MAG: hypothetical protein V1794_10480, partial [Candidatus Glassbacteria bacterium]